MPKLQEVELELTNVWSLLHATTAGCTSIVMWETLKEAALGIIPTLVIYVATNVIILHVVGRHRASLKTKTPE